MSEKSCDGCVAKLGEFNWCRRFKWPIDDGKSKVMGCTEKRVCESMYGCCHLPPFKECCDWGYCSENVHLTNEAKDAG